MADTGRAVVRATDRERGATMVEYALMILLIAIAALVAAAALGPPVADMFSNVGPFGGGGGGG